MIKSYKTKKNKESNYFLNISNYQVNSAINQINSDIKLNTKKGIKMQIFIQII